MKRPVTLVKVDQRIFRDVPPLGLLYLGHALRRAGYPVRIHHILEEELDGAAERLLRDDPLFVGFSVVTGLGIRPTAELSRRVKAAGRAPVVWGCVHPSQLPQQCLAEPYIDIVGIGEGEQTVVELADALAAGSALDGIAGIGYKTPAGAVRLTAPRPMADTLDAFEPDWGLVDINRYLAPQWGIRRTLRVTASRGCPCHCRFCYNQAYNKRRWRPDDPDQVVDRLQELIRAHDVEALFFNDDNFFVNQDWAWSILERLQLPYYVCLRAEYVTEAFAARLARTGCREVLIGYESGSERVMRDILGKGATVRDQVEATRLLARHPSIKILGSFITALPGETPDDVQESIRLMCDFLDLHPNIQLLLAFYRPLPGTELYDDAVRMGFQPPASTEDWAGYDQLANTLDLPWMDAASTRRARRYCEAMDVLAALYKFNVPVLKLWARRLVVNGQVDHALLRWMNVVRRQYAFGTATRGPARWLRSAVDGIKRVKNVD